MLTAVALAGSSAQGRAYDPVCGMSVDLGAVERSWDSRSWWFCSDRCADAFDAVPERYASSGRQADDGP